MPYLGHASASRGVEHHAASWESVMLRSVTSRLSSRSRPSLATALRGAYCSIRLIHKERVYCDGDFSLALARCRSPTGFSGLGILCRAHWVRELEQAIEVPHLRCTEGRILLSPLSSRVVKMLPLFIVTAGLASFCCAQSTFSPLRPPAIPLAVRSPYMSTWQQAGSDAGNGGYLAGQWPTFWA